MLQKNGADNSRIQPETRSRPESRLFLVIIFILGSYVCNVGDHPDVPEVACNRIVRLAFKIYPVRRAVKRLFSSGMCDIGRFALL